MVLLVSNTEVYNSLLDEPSWQMHLGLKVRLRISKNPATVCFSCTALAYVGKAVLQRLLGIDHSVVVMSCCMLLSMCYLRVGQHINFVKVVPTLL